MIRLKPKEPWTFHNGPVSSLIYLVIHLDAAQGERAASENPRDEAFWTDVTNGSQGSTEHALCTQSSPRHILCMFKKRNTVPKGLCILSSILKIWRVYSKPKRKYKNRHTVWFVILAAWYICSFWVFVLLCSSGKMNFWSHLQKYKYWQFLICEQIVSWNYQSVELKSKYILKEVLCRAAYLAVLSFNFAIYEMEIIISVFESTRPEIQICYKCSFLFPRRYYFSILRPNNHHYFLEEQN